MGTTYEALVTTGTLPAVGTAVSIATADPPPSGGVVIAVGDKVPHVGDRIAVRGSPDVLLVVQSVDYSAAPRYVAACIVVA